jgi:hypothetical protein
MKPKLAIIKNTHRPVVDIYASWRAEIADRDWRSVHETGDRRAPIDLPDTRKRGWLA